MASVDRLQAGYGNGGIEPIEQFDKLCEKITNSLKNLEFTRDMLRQLAETEKKSAKEIAAILNKKSKSLRFSVVDQAIQNYWKKIESSRRHFSSALNEKIVAPLNGYINSAYSRKKQLQKENSKTKKSFIDIEKERAKQKQICEKEWKKLEDQIKKNDGNKKANKMNKIKDLKSLQDKTSKAFKKMENLTLSLNELEQQNHKTACDIGALLHESQKFAAQRLSIHYNTSVITKKYLEEFISTNKSIVQSKAPPLTDILWRWLTYPKNHQTRLPCTSNEVYQKKSIAQRFKRRVEDDYQKSKYLKAPKIIHHKQNKQKQQQQQQPKKKQKKPKKKDKKQPESPKTKAPPIPAANNDDNWDVAFGDDDNNNNNTSNVFDTNNNNDFPSTGNVMSDEEFFGASTGFDDDQNNAAAAAPPQPTTTTTTDTTTTSTTTNDANNAENVFDFDNNDIFSEAADSKPVAIKQKEKPKEKNLVEKHEEEMKEQNNFDHGFGNDDFDTFGDNTDINIANENAQNNDVGGFGADDWGAGFGDDTFAVDENDKKNNDNDNVDALFVESQVNQTIFGDDAFNGNGTIEATPGNNDKSNDNDGGGGGDAFAFGADDFAASFDDDKKNKKNEATPPPPANLDDDMFNGDGFNFDENNNGVNDVGGNNDDVPFGDDDDDDAFGDKAMEFPEFDDAFTTTTTTTTKPKKRKSKIKKKKKPKEENQPEDVLTTLPYAVVSFDAEVTPQPAYNDNNKQAPPPPAGIANNESNEIEDDNPFGNDPFAGGDDDDDNNNNNNHDDDDDEIDADNPFAMFDEPEEVNNNNDQNNDNGIDAFDPFG